MPTAHCVLGTVLAWRPSSELTTPEGPRAAGEEQGGGRGWAVGEAACREARCAEPEKCASGQGTEGAKVLQRKALGAGGGGVAWGCFRGNQRGQECLEPSPAS